MYINDFRYGQLAFVIVQGFVDDFRFLKDQGLIPAKFDINIAIKNYLPEKYNDDNTDSRSGVWTSHNEQKLKKYIKVELQIRRFLHGR